MTLSNQKLFKLSRFSTASWALWSEKFNYKECLESDAKNDPHIIYSMIENQIEKLKNDIVFLGLNRSLRKGTTAIVEHIKFANFHSVAHRGDAFLKQVIEEYPILTGSYMTDLSLDQESKSKKVNIKNLNSFFEQLNIISSNKYYIICFGDKVFKNIASLIDHKEMINLDISNDVERFIANYNGMELHFYKIIHYSYAVRYSHQDRFRRQLQEIEKMIREKRSGD